MTSQDNNNRLALLKQMSEADPQDSFLHFAIAMEYKKMDMMSQAIEALEILMTKDPTYVGLYYHLGQWHADEGNKEVAIEILSQGVAEAKKQADFHAISELVNLKQNIELDL